MSIMDKTFEFCDGVSVAASAGTALVGDVVDLEVAAPDFGESCLYLVIAVSTAFASGGSATVQFTLATDDAAAISTTTATSHYKSGVLAYTLLTAGKQIVIELPRGIPIAERYLGILVTTAGATTTAGTINAYLTMDAPTWRSYPDAVN